MHGLARVHKAPRHTWAGRVVKRCAIERKEAARDVPRQHLQSRGVGGCHIIAAAAQNV